MDSQPGPSQQRANKPSKGHAHSKPGPSNDGIPGVSKLKSQIRQTTRLLAKDTLEPQIRIATERRLASLQADLTKAQNRGIEQKNGEKYHMVKFFERKKLLRVIHRAQRHLSSLSASDESAAPEVKSKKKNKNSSAETSESEKEKWERELREARIMLNYVLQYPNMRKYISLFPAAQTTSAEEEETSRLVLPPLLSRSVDTNTLDDSSRLRLQMLHNVQELMEVGELSKTPEVEVGSGEKGRKRKVGEVDIAKDHREEVPEPVVEGAEGDEKKKKKRKKGADKTVAATAIPDAEDDFFE